jgi:FAD/FMN-containing dehydrogenase
MMAFIRSSAQGRTLAPSALYGGVIALPRSQIWDASGTFTFTAAARVPCMTEAEVQLLLKTSSVPGAVPGAELLLNTSSVPGAVPGAVLRPSVIRPLGCGHSWSGYSAVPGAVLLDMTRMDRVLDTTLAVDVVGGPVARHASAHHGAGAGPSVLVQPGLTLRDLRAVLAAHGYTLPSWPMLLDQTVGGAMGPCLG